MKPSEALRKHRNEVLEIIAAHSVTNPRVFGSVIYGDDIESSDIDLLVDPGDKTTLFELAAIQRELETLLEFEVDLVTPKSMSEGIRAKVLAEARTL
ncbi:nucleotidyltransferase [soil metagenome]